MENLLELYRTHEESAIAKTDAIYGDALYRIAHGILGSEEDAREVVNDAYWKIWDHPAETDPPDLKIYFAKTVRQIALKRLEHNTAKKRGSGQTVPILQELEDCFPEEKQGMDPADAIALRDAMQAFLRALPPFPRNVFLRRYWHFQTIEQIAKAHSATESKIKSSLLRTRKKLKKHLQKEGFDL